ncbi:leucine-rich repeat domain-containing protein [Flavobacterium sp. HTF]|uniref:leucine-rich repeat domain-containing protein n=1 Tax=Flavobacterium sp. HTF TaxID=2170732 RepID=UPI000D5F6206|nr:leucine-rich repeat domain-containing protein [Flavobacterium sp. HTF]PWB27640.1 leucine-rich repeat domain-containing protein [Flavobacterium sp. HTF]
MINYYILIPILLLGFYLFGQVQNPSKYKYLFRNVILSKSKKYQLSAVLRGRVYYPRYFYIPSLKQYLVYSDLDETGPFRVYDDRNYKSEGKTYAMLDEEGNNLTTFETPLRFSYRSGCFYGPSSYIPFLETGKKEIHNYDVIHNANLDLGSRDFEKLFIKLYTSSEYVEYINLRVSNDDIHEAGIIFRRQGKVEILLAGLRQSRMVRSFQEDRSINNFEDFYEPDVSKRETFPQSKPSVEMIPLETNNLNPFLYWRIGFKHEFKIEKYKAQYSSGLEAVAVYGILPIFRLGESLGTAYVRFKTKGETFRIKVLEVQKTSLIPAYNLGLRSFRLPKKYETKNSLVFMESVQNGGDNRLGGGVFVVRPAVDNNPSADIPSDITEKHFQTLPVALQEALLHPDETTSLKLYDKEITEWIPELERLKNLTHLEMTLPINEIPDGIAKLTKLQHLSLENCNIQKISTEITKLTELKELNLFSNKLTEFPSVITELKNLNRLNVGANKIAAVPENINQLKELRYLSLMMTDVKTLPESMIGMEKLYVESSNNLESLVPKSYEHLFNFTKP